MSTRRVLIGTWELPSTPMPSGALPPCHDAERAEELLNTADHREPPLPCMRDLAEDSRSFSPPSARNLHDDAFAEVADRLDTLQASVRLCPGLSEGAAWLSDGDAWERVWGGKEDSK